MEGEEKRTQSNIDGDEDKKEELSLDGGEKGEGGFFSAEDIVSKLSGSRKSNRSRTSNVSHRSAALSATSSISLNDISSGGGGAGFSHLLEQKFFELVNENESRQVEEMLWKYKHEVQVGGRDGDGFSALGIAAVSGSLEMMETLLRSGSPITDEPLICIEQDFKQGLMLLLDKLAKRGVDGANLT
ncbi:uncharacterized protein LOC142356503, partial [Convolutriloba macropyga]|uniref:uncharacterized protein LOC142356503 n=1 Tax=Convolutriloba macropyga TaxID=536237 RepID=UPI003F52088F